MQQHQLKNGQALENYKIFRYIAWTVTILFAVFIYNLAQELKQTAEKLESQASRIEAKVSATGSPAYIDYEN